MVRTCLRSQKLAGPWRMAAIAMLRLRSDDRVAITTAPLGMTGSRRTLTESGGHPREQVIERASLPDYCPVPVNVSYSGLVMLPLLSLSTMLPVLAPVAVGVKVTVTVQLPPVINGVGQLLVCAKFPVAPMLSTVTVVAPTIPNVSI